jgi:aminomethyltransferase
MLDGVLTGVLPAPPAETGDGGRTGVATYHAVLTPKGKMITDLVALLPGDEADPGFLLDVPEAGRSGLLAHLGKFLPPRFAAVTDVSDGWGAIAVVGPDAAERLSRTALGLRVDAHELEAGEEGAWHAMGASDACVVASTADVWPPAWNVYGPAGAVRSLRDALVRDGTVEAGADVWDVLRVEAGRPAFGPDMDESTLPPEAGIVDRAIDQAKGCYTGQEVIVRIRDRGHVNRHLRRLALGDGPVPAPGTELFSEEGKMVGSVTSAVDSPRAGGVLVLAWVRRGVERARLGAPDGAVIDVPAEPPETGAGLSAAPRARP